MATMIPPGPVLGLLITTLVVVLAPVVARAELLNLTIDPSASALTLSASFRNALDETLPLQEQAVGSLTAHFAGTAVVDVTATSIRISVETDAITLPGEFLPTSASISQPTPADLAGRVLNFDPDAQGWYAVRDIVFFLGSGSIAMNAAGRFSVSSVGVIMSGSYSFFTGNFDTGGGVGSLGNIPLLATNGATTRGRFQRVGDEYVLTIPIDLPWTSFGPFSEDLVPLSGRLQGQIVATAAVPEASSLALLATGLITLGVRTATRARNRRQYGTERYSSAAE